MTTTPHAFEHVSGEARRSPMRRQFYKAFKRPFDFSPAGPDGRWYSIQNSSADVADVYIYDEIGGWGVTAAQFSAELRSIKAGTISLHVSSPGGDVWDGLTILNSLRQHPARVEVSVDGIAASAASFIAMAGDVVRMAPQSLLMIHDALALAIGNSADLRETADLLDKASDNIAEVYATRAGGTTEEWRAAMREETWYTAQEAVDAGLADELGDAPKSQPTDRHTGPALHEEISQAMDVVAGVVESAERVGALRAEQGKTLSQRNRDGLDGLADAVQRLQDLLNAEPQNEVGEDASDDMRREFARFVAITQGVN